MANEKGAREPNPLVERVDALLRRHEQANEREANDRPAAYGQGGADVPVLTETVDDVPPPVTFDSAALEALARELERAVLERLGPEVDRVIEERLARTLSEVLGQALDGVRSELTVSVTQMVREAIAASVAQALGRNPGR